MRKRTANRFLLERLEQRKLLAATPPTATYSGSDIEFGGEPYHLFTVVYSTPDGINAATLDDQDIMIIGPRGFAQPADFQRSAATSTGGLAATYRIDAPGGRWDSADLGIYQVSLQAGQVQSSTGASAAASEVGTFRVNLGAYGDGVDNDIAIDAAGRVWLAYYDRTLKQLRYAWRSPKGAWSESGIIDNSSADVGAYVSLALDNNGTPGVAYFDGANTSLKYAKFNGSGWNIATVDDKASVGQYPSIAFDPANNPLISYWHRTNGDLRLAANKGTGWSISTVDSTGDVGRSSSLAFNKVTGTWGIAYADSTNNSYKVALQAPGAWQFSTVDKSVVGGGFITLAFDPTGKAAFTYYDSYAADLKFAIQNGTGWQKETLVWKNVQGQYATLAFLPSGEADIVYYHKTANGVYNLRGRFGNWHVDQSFLGGGKGLHAAYDAKGNRIMSWLDTVSGLLMVANSLAAPTDVSVSGDPSGAKLTWIDHSSNEVGFVIRRSTDGATWSTITTTAENATSFTDTTAANGVTYYYSVSAKDAAGKLATASNVSVRIGSPGIFSQDWKDNWTQALAANHPWAKMLIDNANASGTAAQRYSDVGDWGTYAYVLTGNVTYADKAWAIISARLQPSTDFNFLRSTLTRYALLYYGLKQGGYWQLHPDRRQTFADMLNTWSDATLNHPGFRFDDSDQMVGALGITMWALISQGENPRAQDFLNDARLGGLNVTSTQRTSVRNSIADYCRRAAGGQWIESTSYNLETLEDLIMATEGIHTVTGHEYFPEVAEYYQQAALSEMAIFTPDLKQTFQWGDVEWPRQLQPWYRVGMLGMLAGVTQDKPIGPYIQKFISDLAGVHGWTGNGAAEPWGHMFFTFNPMATQANWRTLPAFAAPAGGVGAADNPGQGFTFVREGTGPNSTFLGLLNYTFPAVDHGLPNASDIQLYHNGEWVFTHPIGYQTGALATNTTLVAGFGRVSEATGRVAYEIGTAGSYVYSAGSAGGSTVWEGYWSPPATFIQEVTRSTFYLPAGSAGGVPTILTFDRMNVDQPNQAGYHYQVDWDRIVNSPLKEMTFHSPVAPTVNLGADRSSLTWQTVGGQNVRVDLLSAGLNVSAVQATVSAMGGGFASETEQAGYFAQVTPNVYHKWDTFLSVVQAGAITAGVSNQAVSSAGGEAKGALVRRPGMDDVIVLFNARQAADLPPVQTVNDKIVYNPELLNLLAKGRLHQSGFGVAVTTTTASATVHVADLDPTKQWTVRVDGGAVTPLTVSTEGLGHVTLSGAGSHNVVVAVAA